MNMRTQKMLEEAREIKKLIEEEKISQNDFARKYGDRYRIYTGAAIAWRLKMLKKHTNSKEDQSS